MSLEIAQSIAFSGLAATQVRLSVASSNISNADTTGYTEKTATQQASVTGGVGTGVTVTGISGAVDKLLLKSLIGATSDLGSADTANSYLTQLQKLYGSTTSSTSSGGTTLADAIATLETALTSLAATPSSTSLQSNVVSALDNIATQLRDTSGSIQKLRGNADKDIASQVGSVNTDLQQIADLNAAIKQQAASGQSTADLEDQRNTALQDIASKMNINYYTASNGDLQVYTTSGQVLVDGNNAHKISYAAAANVTAATTYSAGSSSSGFSAITVNGVDVTGQITSGSIGALITLRDTTLPAAQTQLDQLATQLEAAVNAVSNQGTSVPPPTALTGTASVGSSAALSASGTVRIAVADQKGNLVSYQDLDLSGYATAGDLVTALNGISGVSAAIDAAGHLSIKATASGTGISINQMSSAVGSGGEGFSDYFGLNDLLTGSGAGSLAVRSDILSGGASLPTAMLDASTSLTAGSQVLSAGSATLTNALHGALTGSTDFAAAGGLGATTGSFTDYASSIVANVATKASAASSAYDIKQTTQSTYANSLSSETGVNLDEESARLSALQNKYSAATQLITTINAMYQALLTAVQSAG
ncbi:flagellar hook-associated protein FlgK [Bradyrhizobium sp. WD16]|uniref:flagellar hook-associated protein FlgK n=1 Tax=Bradyrhizobium sp. WD16 TaxID=1521768 RepID=UPI0020A3D613|nr:flagellar hook-associated protein FlgK [Bradyrhizobium sp. WD16]UTD25535.1 flagellar hook-associated protein FlgK [Bradyrhizobium sp. WD16]